MSRWRTWTGWSSPRSTATAWAVASSSRSPATSALAISGDRIGAHEALHIGLIDHVLPADDFAEQASAMVERYLRVPQAAARATKELARSSFDTDFATAYARSRELVQQCLDASDAGRARTAWTRRRD